MPTFRNLLPAERELFATHLKSLGYNDRLIRFETSVRDPYIDNYVYGINMDTDAILGAFYEEGVLVGAAHIAMDNGVADLGLSVLEAHRKQGIGRALITQAVEWATEQGAKQFSSQCSIHNNWMRKTLHKLGFVLVVEETTVVATTPLEPDPTDINHLRRIKPEDNINWASPKVTWSLAKDQAA